MTCEPLTDVEANQVEAEIVRAEKRSEVGWRRVAPTMVVMDARTARTLFERAKEVRWDLEEKIEKLQDDLNMANAHGAVMEDQVEVLLKRLATAGLLR